MTAQIVMDAGGGPVVGSLTLPAAEVGTPVTVSNADNTGVAGWRWELLDAPEPSATYNPLPAPSFGSTDVFTPDVEGHTLMLRLTTYKDAARTQIDDIDQQVLRVRFPLPFDWVIPAAQESIEANALRGWASEVNRTIREIHAYIDGGGSAGQAGVPIEVQNGETYVVPAGRRVLAGAGIDVATGGEVIVEDGGELVSQLHKDNQAYRSIPFGMVRTIQPFEVMRTDDLLVSGTLHVLGELSILPDHDGAYILSKLTDIAPDAGGILGALSPARFLTAAEVRTFLDVLTSADVDAAAQVIVDAAIAGLPPAGALPVTALLPPPAGASQLLVTNTVNRLDNDIGWDTKVLNLPDAAADGDVCFIQLGFNSLVTVSIATEGAGNILRPDGIGVPSMSLKQQNGTFGFRRKATDWVVIEGQHRFLNTLGRFHTEYAGSAGEATARSYSADVVYCRSTLNDWLPLTISPFSMLVKQSAPSDIQSLTIPERSIITRVGGGGNVAPVALAGDSVVGRLNSGEVAALGGDAVAQLPKPEQTLVDAATIDYDVSAGVNAVVTITASRSIDLWGGGSGLLRAGMRGMVRVIQGGAGNFGLTWLVDGVAGNAHHPGGLALANSASPGDVDLYEWYFDGTRAHITVYSLGSTNL